jgi:hypothetical protein
VGASGALRFPLPSAGLQFGNDDVSMVCSVNWVTTSRQMVLSRGNGFAKLESVDSCELPRASLQSAQSLHEN